MGHMWRPEFYLKPRIEQLFDFMEANDFPHGDGRFWKQVGYNQGFVEGKEKGRRELLAQIAQTEEHEKNPSYEQLLHIRECNLEVLKLLDVLIAEKEATARLLDILPKDVMKLIFVQLKDKKDLIACSKVCKKWNNLIKTL